MSAISDALGKEASCEDTGIGIGEADRLGCCVDGMVPGYGCHSPWSESVSCGEATVILNAGAPVFAIGVESMV